MISHGTEIKVFTGNSNPELAKKIVKSAAILWVPLRLPSLLTANAPFLCWNPFAARTFLLSSLPVSPLMTA